MGYDTEDQVCPGDLLLWNAHSVFSLQQLVISVAVLKLEELGVVYLCVTPSIVRMASKITNDVVELKWSGNEW